ncbi:sugar phosphate isomerase/epimerase [Sinorhizobium meliloti]|uniref:sugar phosphate isomerase/epimerase family protein n=1 Tax=Rhizobium meliloti TaxID=382 RepID=UPI00207482B4|nr:sugar phosphate isomerase/epimerase family protein [Sinorhizobium meliloti]MCM5693042.1 sugar phosphate isomerase/epimerase [Sinorhizobium meliloti]
MKIGFITDELTQDFELAVQIGSAIGAPGIELRSAWGLAPDRLTRSHLQKIRELTAKYNCQLTVYCSPFGKEPLPQSKAAVDECRTRLQQEINRALDLGAGSIRIFPFLRSNDPEPYSAGRALNCVLDGISNGELQILVETGTLTNAPNIDDMISCLSEITTIDKSKLGVLWDPGNTAFAGFAKRSFIEEYRLGSDLIRHIHVKDPVAGERYVKLGCGEVGWQELLPTLKAQKYSGWLSLETHWRFDRILSANERRMPWGEGFTQGGFQPTIECIIELKRLYDDE